MPDPILPTVMRAMWIWQGKSGLPEDRFVNTFYFERESLATYVASAGAVRNILEAFYTGVSAAGTRLTDYINGAALSGAQLRVYDLGEAPPRTPTIFTPTVTLGTSTAVLPHECAVTLSLATAKKGPRGRGRIYLGPLTTAAGQVTTGVMRPVQSLRDCLADRSEDMMGSTEDAAWAVLSRMDGEISQVTGGYVDDAFDTQRRRGIAPTSRKIWGGYVLAA